MNELEALRDWIGREETQHDIITAAPVTALAATLDHDPHPVPDGSALPPLWHWLYFTPRPRAGAVGPDGHAWAMQSRARRAWRRWTSSTGAAARWCS